MEIRGSNPLGGTSTRGRTPLLPSIPMEIMGIQIRTIVKDNVAIRCDGCLKVIDGTPWRVNLLDIVAAEAPVAWTDRPTINPGPFQFHRDPACVRRWMAGKGFLFCRRGEVREIMRPVRDPDRSARLGPVRRHPSRRSRVRPGLTERAGDRHRSASPLVFDRRTLAPISSAGHGLIVGT